MTIRKALTVAGLVVGALAVLAVVMTLLALMLPSVGCAVPPAPTPPPPTTTTTTVAPSPSPTPIATPTPEIEPCFPVGGTWEPSPPERQDPEEMLDFVREAEEYLGDRCGHADATEAPQRESLRLLAAELESRGFCAGFMEPDAVFVEREDGRFEEHHAYHFGDGCALSNSFRGIWEHRP